MSQENDLDTFARRLHEMAGTPLPRAAAAPPARLFSPIPLLGNESVNYVFEDATLYEPRIVGEVHQQVTAPTHMTLNGVPIPVDATAGFTAYQAAELEMGRGTLVLTTHRLVFVCPAYGLSMPLADILGLSGSENNVTVIRANQSPIRIVSHGRPLGTAVGVAMHDRRV